MRYGAVAASTRATGTVAIGRLRRKRLKRNKPGRLTSPAELERMGLVAPAKHFSPLRF
jgi:hypothetical protein